MSETLKSDPPQVPARHRRSTRAAGERVLNHASAIFLRAGFKDPGFLLHWPAIAGAHIARVAQPVKWQESPAGAVVTLRCEPSAAVLLQHETRSLVEKSNAWLGAGRIARFKLTPGPLPRANEIAAHPAPERDWAAGKVELLQALDRLGRLRAKLSRS
jgi:hypothetical protein